MLLLKNMLVSRLILLNGNGSVKILISLITYTLKILDYREPNKIVEWLLWIEEISGNEENGLKFRKLRKTQKLNQVS